MQVVQPVGGNGIVEARVAVDPDGVEPLFQGAGILLLLPLPGHHVGGVDDVAQPQHDAGATGAQHGQHGVQLGQGAARHVVDDEQPGRKGGEGGQNGPGAQVDQFLQRQAQRTRAVAAVGLLLVGRQRDAVDALRQRKCARFANAGDQQHVGRQRWPDQCLGQQRVAADVAQPHGVMGVQGNARGCAGNGGSGHLACRWLCGEGFPPGGRGPCARGAVPEKAACAPRVSLHCRPSGMNRP